MSERLACRMAKQPRGTQLYRPTQRDDEDTLPQALVMLPASTTLWLSPDHSPVATHRLERRQVPGGVSGLANPKMQKPRGRLWLRESLLVRPDRRWWSAK